MTDRTLFASGFALCAALLAIALYFQYGLGLEPCPLCIVQRVVVTAIGVVLLAGTLHHSIAEPRTGRRVYGLIISVLAGTGIAVAGRHVWLQSLPPERVPACGPDLSYLLQAFPWTKVLELVLKGSGECAKVDWTFLGLSIPAWTLIFFCGFALFGAWLLFSRPRTV